jgi:PAS domain S-box-containing protein
MHTILLVDDSALDREIIFRYLRHQKELTLFWAADMSSGLKTTEERQPDLILLDYRLPDGNALNFLSELIKKHIKVPVIILTGVHDKGLALSASTMGAIEFLVKDEINREILLEYIRKHLDFPAPIIDAPESLPPPPEPVAIRLPFKKGAESLYKLLIETMNEGLVVFDEEGIVTFINQRLLEMTEQSLQEVLGVFFMNLFPEIEKKTIMQIYESLQLVGKAQFESAIRKASGEKLDVMVVIQSLTHVDASSKGYFALFTNITDIMNKQRQIEAIVDRLAEAVDKKMLYFAELSHELKTPISTIMGYAQLLKTQILGNLTHEQVNGVDTILRQTSHLLSLIQDILDYSKLESGTMEIIPEVLDAHDFFGEIIESTKVLCSDRDYRVRLDIENSLEQISADPLRLRQVIMNLLTNAIKFTERGGVILRVGRGAQKNISSQARAGKPYDLLDISVIDTGIGIERDQQAQIFELFHQAPQSKTMLRQGTGLGLAISRMLVDLMGGQLSVDSTPGQGSTFSITLPAVLRPEKNSI